MKKRFGFRLGLSLVAVVVAVASGCGGKPVRPLEIASDAGKQAVNTLDANKDGVLDYKELAKAPGCGPPWQGSRILVELAVRRHRKASYSV